MNVSIEYQGNRYDFPLWTNKLEKEIILSAAKSITCQENMENMFPIINQHDNLEDIHYLDKLYFFLKCREYSVGNVISNMIVCNGCKQPQQVQYKISDNLVFKTSPNTISTEYGDIVLKNNQMYLGDVLLEDIEDLHILIYIKNNVLKNIEHDLYIHYKHQCYCGHINLIKHNEEEILHDIVISMEVGELYKYYANMQYNYSLSYNDLDNMFSFERNIYKNIYDTIEKEKDSNKNGFK